MIPDRDTLNLYVEKGLITVQVHPVEPLFIYNYAAKAQYERVWDEVTTVCRGLILDEAGEVIARPFPKFFNLEEHSRSDIVFTKPFKVQEKADGSLGIFYKCPSNEKWAVATRGSFTSVQALKATDMYVEKYAHGWQPAPGFTTLVEIIYPANRIVVDYGDREELRLITTINNVTGRDVPEPFWAGPRVESYKTFDPVIGGTVKPRDMLEHLGFTDDGNTEGIVMIFDWPKEGPQTRIKVKLEEYKRLHYILTGVSTKTIWSALKEGRSMEDVLERIPDEFYNWVTATIQDLSRQFNSEREKIQEGFNMLLSSFCPPPVDPEERIDYARKNRKSFAEEAKKSKNCAYYFCLLDGKSIDDKIWDAVRPVYSKAFTNDIDA